MAAEMIGHFSNLYLRVWQEDKSFV